MERPRRRKGSNVSDAIEKLKEGREGGVGSRAKSFSVKEETSVYDVVDEENYAHIVEQRRQEGGDFVVDDDGLGYADVGDEDWFGSEAPIPVGSRSAEGFSKINPAGRLKMSKDDSRRAKRQAVDSADPRAKKRLQQMFHKAAVKPANASKASNESSDALLESILNDIQKPGSSPGSVPQPRMRRSPDPSIHRSSPQIPAPALKSPRRQSKSISMDTPHDDFTFDTPQGRMDEDCGGGLMALAGLIDGEIEPHPDGGRPKCLEDDGQEPQPEEVDEPKHTMDSGPPSPTSIPDVNKLRISTPPEESPKVTAQSFKAPEPQTFAPVSGWQEVQGMNEVSGDAADEIPWEDDGTLPLTDSEILPFFLIDALEEQTSPGVLYLFGKVPCKDSHQYASCCSIVRDLDRILYVVPNPDIIDVNDSEISRLESEVAKDPGSKIHLMKYLQLRAEPVKQEVRTLLLKAGLKKFRMKPVKRKYAFEEKDVAHGEQYVLKVYCPGSAVMPLSMKGETFTHVFGLHQSLLELLLLKRKIMGPSWIGLKKPVRKEQNMHRSWCNIEVELSGHKSVMRTPSSEWAAKPPPELKVAAINLKTCVNPNTQVNEVVVASVVHLERIACDGPTNKAQWNAQIKHFSGVTKLRSQPWPPGFEVAVKKHNESPMGRRNGGNVCKMLPSERALLNYFLTRLKAIDPDVLVGHNIAAFDVPVLLHRMQHNKVEQWSRLGRFRRQKYPSLFGGGQVFGGGAGPGVMSALAGRLLCDTYLSARELVKEVDYTLTTLSKSLLGELRNDLSISDVPTMYHSPEGVSSLIQHSESDAYLSMGLVFQLSVLPLTKQLTNLSGSMWNRTLQGQRAQRIEMLLLHEFHTRKYLLPDKLSSKERAAKAKMEGNDTTESATSSKARKKAQYAGGLVLEPKKGLYDKFVLLLDFNSLYPSIIQEYNICFTTVARHKNEEDGGGIAELPEASRELAPLPIVIRNLVQRRRQAKTLMGSTKDATQKQQLNIRQQALKLTANSMYGCLGFGNSRFFCKPLAELITSQGREILQSTVDLVQGKLGLEVVYGDTDSIMINTGKVNIDEVIQLGMAIKKEVNKHYRLLEIDIDGVFKSLLLLKKKKYAAIKVEALGDGKLKEEMEQKGLDIVRRDWCPLSKTVGNFALKEILSGKPKEDVVMSIHEHLREVKEKVMAGDLELGQYIITKQLTKAPEDYPDAKSQPHVQVAIRRKKEGKRDGVLQGETVPYVICIANEMVEMGEDTKTLANRAFHPEEIVSQNMEVDKNYYLAHQVHPSVSRLCAPIEGTDESRLADCLGLDPSKFHHKAHADTSGDLMASPSGFMDDDERFKDCEPLTLVSPDGSHFPFCGITSILKGVVSMEDALAPPDAAGSVSQRLPPPVLVNQVTLLARRFVAQYYDAWMKTDDESNMQTRDISLKSHFEASNQDLNPSARTSTRRVVDERQLYLQLSHLHRLLDVPGACTRLKIESQDALRKLGGTEGAAALQAAARAVAQIRDRCQFRWVSMSKIFG